MRNLTLVKFSYRLNLFVGILNIALAYFTASQGQAYSWAYFLLGIWCLFAAVRAKGFLIEAEGDKVETNTKTPVDE